MYDIVPVTERKFISRSLTNSKLLLTTLCSSLI